MICAVLSLAAAVPAAETNQDGVVEGNNKFALDLYQKLHSEPGNLFFSPYSISTALAFAYAGARGETEKQMRETLCFPASISNKQFHEEFGKIIGRLNEAGQKGAYELVVANALWGQKDYKFLNDFLTVVRESYAGDLQQVDFIKQTEEARQTINAWVEEKTRDKIKELIKPGMIDAMTRLVLTNAIYFKGKWASQFKPEQTQNAPFTLLDGQKVNVPMMTQTEKFGYTETDTAQVLEMSYVNDELAMVVFLPKKIDGVGDLEKELTSGKLGDLLDRLRKREVVVFLPRFKMTKEFELSQTLYSMGMPDAFSGRADFSGMTGDKELFISAVIHKAYVDVNEEGTEAAAATGIVMKLTAVEPPPPIFRADRPFVFIIRDKQSGSILFMGRVANFEN
jgi:serpin B